jgi:glycosyltransferase involved in cell wall biosynthesis
MAANTDATKVSFRFHILGIPHAASNGQWLCCAYTQKVIKLCAMLKARGHYVIHYGNIASEVDCDEHVTVTDEGDLDAPKDYMKWDLNSSTYRKFYVNAITSIHARKQPRDFLLCMWGTGHKPVADVHNDLIVIEPGIGYAGGHFAPFKVFESYAMFHAYYGTNAVATSHQMHWYDVVIPNYFNPDDFKFQDHKKDYLLFLGRVYEGKGIHIAQQLAKAVGQRLVIAGPCDTPPACHNGVEYVGIVDAQRRRELLAGARALVAPSTFLEPFCGTVTEAHFSGTPTITPDWGAFAENNLHGFTGFRCRTFEHFQWAARNIDQIDPHVCRKWALQNFSMNRIGDMYEEFFQSVMSVKNGGDGWYQPNPQRRELDWLMRQYP